MDDETRQLVLNLAGAVAMSLAMLNKVGQANGVGDFPYSEDFASLLLEAGIATGEIPEGSCDASAIAEAVTAESIFEAEGDTTEHFGTYL